MEGDVEQPGQERDEIELVEGEDAEGRGERDRSQGCEAPDVAGDQDRPPPNPVGERTQEQADPDEGKRLQRPQDGDLERTGMESEDRHRRHRQVADRAAEGADRLPDPEQDERKVPFEAPHRRRG
ncbi:MAG TPA: hypothetical protein VIO86_09715 [Candidatus Dormibacteraeota bacterium]